MSESSDDREQRLAQLEAQLKAKLQPWRIRATLSFAGLYQITHELIKSAVIDEVRQFYLIGFDEFGLKYDEASYHEHVVSRDPKNKFHASLLWLIDAGAITTEQADRLDEIYAHRHQLTHELAKYIVDPAREPDAQLFIDALEILRAIRDFWARVEIETGTFEGFGAVSVEDVESSQLLLLQLCIDAYAEGLVDAPSDENSQRKSTL